MPAAATTVGLASVQHQNNSTPCDLELLQDIIAWYIAFLVHCRQKDT